MINFMEIANGLFSVLGAATFYTFICWGVGAGLAEKAGLERESESLCHGQGRAPLVFLRL